MRVYGIIFSVFYFLLLIHGAQLSKRINETLTIQCQCQDSSICNWYHNDQTVPNQWIQANGDLILPANDWSVYGIIIGQCGSENKTNVITNPGVVCMYICNT